MWQDTVIAVCQLCFFFAMLPTLLGKSKPPFSTCLMNVILITIITICLGTLGMWFSVVTAALAGLTWFILCFQTYGEQK
jgi:hypothetical protein